MAVTKLLIANRGEIAVRIIRAAQSLGIETVAVYSTADADMLAVRMADEAIEIGPPQAAKSYLNAEAILGAARATGADAVHPGYGFLAENAEFADAVAEEGLIFVGPSGDTIRLMGDKAAARSQADKAGLPTVPGSDGIVAPEEGAQIAKEIGFPVMIKATAGGGGRGIRIARTVEEFNTMAPQASVEALAAFGDGGVYVEKVIENARHVEVQILGDGMNAIHCWERECSLQRRRQKVWEEAPSTALDEETRARLCYAAVDLARSVGYKGAGTVEYLYDDKTHDFFFIEMNTRIQVEHPVTEMITGLDLVAEMIHIAGGAGLSIRQEDVSITGHAIEVRLNAEDPMNNFMPFPGVVSNLNLPEGEGIRIDHMLYEGYVVPPFYDSLLGKLIVYGKNREAALARLGQALGLLRIDGLACTAPLFSELLSVPDIQANAVHTKWLEHWLDTNTHKFTIEEGGKAA